MGFGMLAISLLSRVSKRLYGNAAASYFSIPSIGPQKGDTDVVLEASYQMINSSRNKYEICEL